MTTLEWAAVLGVFAAWSSLILALITALHNNRKTAMHDMETRLVSRLLAQAEAADKAHTALTIQVRDIADQVRSGYVDRREFDATVKTIQVGVTQLGRDIGAVGNRVEAVGSRIDHMLNHGSWHRSGD